jgi:hypothetical protein
MLAGSIALSSLDRWVITVLMVLSISLSAAFRTPNKREANCPVVFLLDSLYAQGKD